MKKETEKLAKATVSLQEDLSKLSLDEINRSAPSDEPEAQEKSLEMIARNEGAIYVKPKRRLSPPLGSLDSCKHPEKIKKEHERAWEYVKGVYENLAIPGEPLTFALRLFPGDADYLWEIPCNVPVYVPRMVANHLEEAQKFHTFGHVQKPPTHWQQDDFTHQFQPTGTHYRGKFRPLGAFA